MTFSLRHQHTEMVLHQVIAAKSNILRNKTASVMGIRITFTCFQTLCSRKRGFPQETGFSLPQPSIPLRWSKFFRMERASISITWNRGKGGAIHPKFSNELGFCRRQPRLVTHATEISLLGSLVASQQEIVIEWPACSFTLMLSVFLRGVLDDGKDTFYIAPVSGYKVSMTRAIKNSWHLNYTLNFMYLSSPSFLELT